MKVPKCKVALQLNKCFAMQAEFEGSEVLLQTLNELLTDGTLECGSVEKTVKGTRNFLNKRRSGTQIKARDILGTHMHGLQTSPAARKWAGLGLIHTACFVICVQRAALVCGGGRNLGKQLPGLRDLDTMRTARTSVLTFEEA